MSNSHLFLKSGFLRVPLQNGVGRYVRQLQRITLKFCKNQATSRGMRDFIQNDMIQFAKEQPEVVVYLKPRRHRDPVLVAEYRITLFNGDRKWMHCRDMTREEVARWVYLMSGCSDDFSTRFRKPWHTSHPSIQGPWTPFNLYPFKAEEPAESTAYSRLLELAKEQGININDSDDQIKSE